MSRFNQLLILIALLILTLSAKLALASDAECLQRMVKDTEKSEEDITTMLTNCAIKFMEGETIYLKKGPVKKIYYNDNTNLSYQQEMTASTKAKYIFEFNECQRVSYLVNKYLKKCNELSKNKAIP